MSSTSDQMTQQSKTRLIIDEIGVDTETGIIGRGHSHDNGKTFTVDDTIYGRIYHADDHGKIWQGIQDQVAKVVAPAKSAADSAVSAADDAVASAQVTSAAVSAVASATAEAKQGANESMSRAKSAWDVATGAKEAVTDFDPLLKSAKSDASKALTQIADTASALSDAKTSFGSDVTEAKQLANTAQTTADSAVKSASSVADDLAAVANQAKANTNGITKVTSDVGLLQTTVADNSGNISKIQETASQIQQAVSDNAGNITVATQTADSAVAVASDARSNATVAIQTASQASITASNASGQAASAVLTANGAMTTASNAKSDATVAVQTASGASLTATNAQSDATIAKQTASEATVQASNAESDFAQLSIRANKIEANVANNSGAIASVQQTASGLTTSVGNVDDRVKTIEDKTNWTTKTGSLDMNTLTTTQNIYYRDTNLQNADGEAGWAYIQVVSTGERVTQTVWHDRSSIQHTRTGAVSGSSYNWDAWNKTATDAQVTQVKQTINGITTTINDPKTGLNATYQTAQGNASTISNVKGDVAQLQTTANGLTIRVGSLESKTNTQQTAIDQNKAAIALKADQTTVDTLKGTVNQNTAALSTQANQIQAKVSASDVTGMLTGYATQTYAQSLVTQTADKWNLNLTNLQTDVNAIKTTGGGVNLLTNTDKDISVTSHTTDGWPAWANIDTGFSFEHGKTYTFSAEANNSNNNITEASIRVFECSTNTQVGIYAFPADGNRHSVTFTIPNDSHNYHLLLYAGHAGIAPGVDVTTTYHHPNLEFGTVAHDWSPAPSDMATVTSVTNLSATVDGIQSMVANYKDGTSSQLTQLSNLIQSKVGTDDFNNLKQAVGLQTLDSADINNMKTNGHYFIHNLANNPIGGWVYVDVTGNGNDRIRQDVYQDSGTKHKYRRWFDTYWTDWEEGATYTEINQLQDAINLRVTKGDLISQINLQAGTSLIQSNKLVMDANTTIFTGEAFIPSAAISELDADKLTFYGANNTYATIGASVAQYDDDQQKSTINLQYNGGIEIHSSNQQGSILTMHDNTIRLASKSWGDNPNAYQYSGFYAAPNYSLMNTYHKDGTTSGVAIDDNQIHIYGNSKDQQLGSLQADVGWYSINGKTGSLTGDQISLKAGNTQAVLTDNNININNASDTNDKNYDVAIHIKGWAEMTGWFTCMGISQTSLLSTKTRIEPLDTKVALDKITSTNVETYQFKSDVAKGKTKRHASVIIDDVNDVAEYYTPEEFISENRMGRDDGDIIGYLMGAVQELKKQLDELKEKNNE